MTFLRIISSPMALMFCVSCISLSYPKEPVERGSGYSAAEAYLPAAEDALSWSDLTRLAREHRQRGELDEASERLAQAATQVALLPATHARRRTVFGMRARLAIDLADVGELEAADELADTLLAEAEAAPELGGAALISLALSVADRRPHESRLPFLRVALTTAQAGATSRERMNLAHHVAEQAYLEKDLPLARLAIDQSVVDAELTGPSKKGQIAMLEVFKARIALDQSDLEAAEQAATHANRLFDEVDADASNRGIAEAILAEVLAEKGEFDKAVAIARGAYARIGNDEPIGPHAQRVILAALARVQRSIGDSASARLHYERALEIPGVDTPADTALVRRVATEILELDKSAISSSRSLVQPQAN